MSLANPFATAKRVIIRETAGRVLRAKAERADNTETIAELLSLRARNLATLQPEDFRQAASAWGLDPAILHALADAESSGRGFEPDGRAVIAVECHAFSDATLHAFDVKHPHLSYPAFTPYERGKPPKGMAKHPYVMTQPERWQLFVLQAELSIEGACSALSVGRFQPLIGCTPPDRRKGRKPGWQELGFISAEAMFRALCVSEHAQLEVLHIFLKVHGLMDAFRRRDWRVIAARYNGPANVAVYSERMETAWSKRRRIYA